MIGRRPLAGVFVAVALLLAGCTSGPSSANYQFFSDGRSNEFSYPATDRKPISELSGPELGGTGTISVSALRGQVVVINFWGSWCGDCRAESADLQAAHLTLKAQGVQFVGIDVKDQQEAGEAYLKAKQITYPSIFDPGQRTLLSLRGYPSNTIPSTIVLDRTGRVAHIWLGTVTRTKLVDTIGPIAAER